MNSIILQTIRLLGLAVIALSLSSCSSCSWAKNSKAPDCKRKPVVPYVEEDEEEEGEEIDWVKVIEERDKAGSGTRGGQHQAFQVAPITIRGKSVSVGTWQSSDEIAPKAEITVTVVASWCGYCRNYLHEMARQPKGRRPDFIVFYQDEVDAMLSRMESEGRISADDHAEMQRQFDRFNQRLISPEAVPAGLDLYFIESGQFSEHIEGFPTMLKCGPDGCEEMD